MLTIENDIRAKKGLPLRVDPKNVVKATEPKKTEKAVVEAPKNEKPKAKAER